MILSARPSIAAVVVTHDSGDRLTACLRSVRAAAGGADLRLVVSDSGSREPPAAVCAEHGAELLLGPNRGFGAAVNRALPTVAGASWVLLCNPDAEVVEGSLAHLAARADTLHRCAAAGPRIVDEERALFHSIGREPTPADYWRAARTTKADWVWDDAVYEAEAPADWLSGCFLLLRTEALRDIGGFDERFFVYSEEVDLCTRLRRAGWQVVYVPALTVMHPAGACHDPHLSHLLVWSKLHYARKWHTRRAAVAMRLALVLLHARQVRGRRRGGLDDTFERAQLAAALRFPRRAYGPPQR